MFARSYSFLLSEWKVLLSFALILGIVGILSDTGVLKSSSTYSTIASILVSYMVIKSILFNVRMGGNAGTNSKPTPRLAFFFKSISLQFGAAAVGGGIYFLSPLWRLETDDYDVFLVKFLMFFLPIYSIVYALLGTWLAADVYGNEKSLGEAFARGRKNFVSNFLIVLLTTVVQIGLAFVLVGILPQHLGHPLDLVGSKTDLLIDYLLNFAASVSSVTEDVLLSVMVALLYLAHLNSGANEIVIATEEANS